VPIVELSGVVKEYRAIRPLRIAALSIEDGQRVAISGLDRDGAELFVNLVNGAVLPDQGRVQVFGRSTADIGSDTEWLASLDRFGVLTERAVLLEGSTLAQNLALPFTLEIDPMPPDVRRRVEALAAEVALPADRLDLPIGDAPVPFRLRVHLGRAIALEPRLLLLEHPTASLPAGESGPFAETVLRLALARRMGVIALTEDAAFAGIVAEQAYKLHGGTGVLTSTRGWRRWLTLDE
jgi:ABC-type transporter Mla maintaining outer membrane lipid asymmetry ATPase subunit MlaF